MKLCFFSSPVCGFSMTQNVGWKYRIISRVFCLRLHSHPRCVCFRFSNDEGHGPSTDASDEAGPSPTSTPAGVVGQAVLPFY